MFAVTYTTRKGKAEGVSVPTLVEGIDVLNRLAAIGAHGFVTAGTRVLYDNAPLVKAYGFEVRS